MKLPDEFAFLIPDGQTLDKALSRTTHLAVGAHPDDLEIMAFHGIAKCYNQKAKWFTGVTVCDGAGSARKGKYARHSDRQMVEVRKREQFRAARIGKYSCQLMLGYTSKNLKSHAGFQDIVKALAEIFEAANPETLYLHNPADKHDTHIALALASLYAVRSLPKSRRPSEIWGCEVWRDLDWLPDRHKFSLPVSGHERLAKKLLGCFKSQIAGGKRYDLATLGRRRAQATFQEARVVDKETSIILALDLLPAITGDLEKYLLKLTSDFRSEVLDGVKKWKKVSR